MTSKQLFPSSPEQVTLTSPGVWLTTQKWGRDDKEILRNGASGTAALKNRRSNKGSRRSAAPKHSTLSRPSLAPSLEMSELTKDPKFAEVPASTLNPTEYSSESDDPDFLQKKGERSYHQYNVLRKEVGIKKEIYPSIWRNTKTTKRKNIRRLILLILLIITVTAKY